MLFSSNYLIVPSENLIRRLLNNNQHCNALQKNTSLLISSLGSPAIMTLTHVLVDQSVGVPLHLTPITSEPIMLHGG